MKYREVLQLIVIDMLIDIDVFMLIVIDMLIRENSFYFIYNYKIELLEDNFLYNFIRKIYILFIK